MYSLFYLLILIIDYLILPGHNIVDKDFISRAESMDNPYCACPLSFIIFPNVYTWLRKLI